MSPRLNTQRVSGSTGHRIAASSTGGFCFSVVALRTDIWFHSANNSSDYVYSEEPSFFSQILPFMKILSGGWQSDQSVTR